MDDLLLLHESGHPYYRPVSLFLFQYELRHSSSTKEAKHSQK